MLAPLQCLVDRFAKTNASTIKSKKRRLMRPDCAFARHVVQKISVIEEVCAGWFPDQFSNIPQGYTYLGQFIAHDITSREDINQRSWRLDLDSVYGKDSVIDQRGRFVYCASTQKYAAEILRDPESKSARIPEFRNDENLIIAQLHFLLQRFHNRVVQELEVSGAGSAKSLGSNFERAKRFVVATFQRIVREDYLAVLSHGTVYDYYRGCNPRFISIAEGETGLPFEMTHASLRFGHSMVRESYMLNLQSQAARDVSLESLFDLTGLHSKTKFDGVPIELTIDWRKFFSASTEISPDPAMRINPSIIKPLTGQGKKHRISLPRLNIGASVSKELCVAQELAERLAAQGADALGVSPELKVQSTVNEVQIQSLQDHRLWKTTPLWLFILLEADSKAAGDSLGPLGSVLLYEALDHAMRIDGKVHYPFVLEEFAQLPKLLNIDSMAALISFTES